MAVLTISSDFGAQENSPSLFSLFPMYLPRSDRTRWLGFFFNSFIYRGGECHLTESTFIKWAIKQEPAAAASVQSCPTLCDPVDGSPPGSPVPGILQARTLEWGAISFSNAWKWKNKVKLLSRVWLLATPWTAAHQAPPSMGFSRQEYWSGLPLPSLKTRS